MLVMNKKVLVEDWLDWMSRGKSRN